jgi:hypothetical protein
VVSRPGTRETSTPSLFKTGHVTKVNVDLNREELSHVSYHLLSICTITYHAATSLALLSSIVHIINHFSNHFAWVGHIVSRYLSEDVQLQFPLLATPGDRV